MHMENYDDRDGRKVWLTRDEVVDVTPDDVDETPSGWVVRVQRGKREVPRDAAHGLARGCHQRLRRRARRRPDDPLVPRTIYGAPGGRYSSTTK